MRTSQSGINLIKSFESLRLKAYKCPAGVWTIGYGHTKGVKPGDVVDMQKAELLLADDLRELEAVVNWECPNVNQNQFDALVSFVFNCGTGSFLKSTLFKCVKVNPQNQNIRYEFGRWTRSKGVELAGLIRRRKAETELYFS